MGEQFLNAERVRELWGAMQTELAKKVDPSDIANFATLTSVATSIATALQPYAKTVDVEKMISDALHVTMVSVDSLPPLKDAKPMTIYFVPNSDPEDDNSKDEYVLIGDKYEKIGSTKVDLSNYWSKDSLRAMTSAELSAILV